MSQGTGRSKNKINRFVQKCSVRMTELLERRNQTKLLKVLKRKKRVEQKKTEKVKNMGQRQTSGQPLPFENLSLTNSAAELPPVPPLRHHQ